MSFPKINIQLGPRWTGLEMTGPVPSLTTDIPQVYAKEAQRVLSGQARYTHERQDNTISNEARQVVADLAHYLHTLNCTTYEISLGFWVPTRTWRIRVEVCELAAAEHPLEWHSEIGRKVRSYIAPGSYEERGIQSAPFANFLDWQKADEKWLHLTKFTVFRGIPFLEKNNGTWDAQEMWAVWILKMADFKVKGQTMPETRLAGGRSREDWESVYENLLS
ncbi:hypothetical protein BDV12DRAFT_202877 [Aspergillus spectabilis]